MKKTHILPEITPLRFRGGAVIVEIPQFPPDQPSPTDPPPIAKLNFHVDTCRVFKIVRITEMGQLAEDGLDNPEIEPWFLLMGAFKGVLRYFIVNGTDHYLPILTGNLNDPDDPANYSLMNPATYKEEMRIKNYRGDSDTIIYEWDMFSQLDLSLVKEAITVYTRDL